MTAGTGAGERIGSYVSRFVENRSTEPAVRIHFLEKGAARPGATSLVYSPGVWEPAERAIPLLEVMDCHCVSLSYRGRGCSGTPARGYDLEHHVADLDAVVMAAGVRRACLVAFSRGVGYALGYALAHPEIVRALVLVDHPPIHVKPGLGYAEYWKNLVYLGRPLVESMRPAAFDALEREAREVVFRDDLPRITVPVLILAGTSTTAAIPSELTQRDRAMYLERLPNAREVVFADSGHMIVDEELGKYRRVVRRFLAELRAADPAPGAATGERLQVP